MARPVPFTAAQYKELEHEALIYKYLVAGVPVPSNLVLPIRRGVEDLAYRVSTSPSPVLARPAACFFVYSSDQAWVYFASIC